MPDGLICIEVTLTAEQTRSLSDAGVLPADMEAWAQSRVDDAVRAAARDGWRAHITRVANEMQCDSSCVWCAQEALAL